MLPQLNSYLDLLSKLEYDIERYTKNNHTYELLDCLLMLNAIPEWIASTKGVSTSLLQLAQEKIQVMKGNVGVFDEDRLDSDLNTQLRCIRLICNHSKHKTDSPHIPTIKSEGGIAFPITFPGTFVNMIFIGEKKVNARKLILDAYNFWKNAIDTL